VYTAAAALGLEAHDTAAVCTVLETLAGHQRKIPRRPGRM
jgi:hypothetical protein